MNNKNNEIEVPTFWRNPILYIMLALVLALAISLFFLEEVEVKPAQTTKIEAHSDDDEGVIILNQYGSSVIGGF